MVQFLTITLAVLAALFLKDLISCACNYFGLFYQEINYTGKLQSNIALAKKELEKIASPLVMKGFEDKPWSPVSDYEEPLSLINKKKTSNAEQNTIKKDQKAERILG